MGIKIEDVEQAIIDAIKADPILGDSSKVKKVDRYDGQFGKDDIASALTGLPGIFVTYTRDTLAASTPGSTYVQTNQFNVVVATKDLRTNFKAKQGSLGAFELCEKVHSLLHLNTLGLSDVVHGLERTGRFPALVDKRISVYEMTFNIKWVD